MEPGDRVLYIMRQFDADEVNKRRDNFQRYQAEASHGIHPHEHTAAWTGAPGYVAHIGMTVIEGEELPADVVAVLPGGNLELRVLLRGTDVHWLRNVPEGDGEPGGWYRRKS